MLATVIKQYLNRHKRLVVPQLGAFIVKRPGEVLFSELLKRDDGTLRGLLCGEGRSELEAAGEIDRFVFEARHAVERGEEYPIAGFGLLRPGPNGTIAFVYRPEGESPEGDLGADLAVPSVSPVAGESAADGAPVSGSGGEPRLSRSAKMQPDPSVRGLRYGKPPRTTDAYTYVDRPPRRRADRFIWIALAAAAVALAAIAFGLVRDARERQAEAETVERMLPEAGAPAADSFPQTHNE